MRLQLSLKSVEYRTLRHAYSMYILSISITVFHTGSAKLVFVSPGKLDHRFDHLCVMFDLTIVTSHWSQNVSQWFTGSKTHIDR